MSANITISLDLTLDPVRRTTTGAERSFHAYLRFSLETFSEDFKFLSLRQHGSHNLLLPNSMAKSRRVAEHPFFRSLILPCPFLIPLLSGPHRYSPTPKAADSVARQNLSTPDPSQQALLVLSQPVLPQATDIDRV